MSCSLEYSLSGHIFKYGRIHCQRPSGSHLYLSCVKMACGEGVVFGIGRAMLRWVGVCRGCEALWGWSRRCWLALTRSKGLPRGDPFGVGSAECNRILHATFIFASPAQSKCYVGICFGMMV